tara:strand:+ start:1024 stop:1131 length:108 start_codon:yes stop_codon:yes gene_type:complete
MPKTLSGRKISYLAKKKKANKKITKKKGKKMGYGK